MEDLTLGEMLRKAMERKAAELGGRFSYRDLEEASTVDHSHIVRIVNGQKGASPGVLRDLSRALEPFFPINRALLAAGWAPEAELRERLLQSDDIDSIEPAEDEDVWLEDLPVAHGSPDGGGGTTDQFAFWPVRHGRRGNRVKLRIRGACMSPAVDPGDYVVIDLEDKPRNMDIVVVETEGFLSLRRYHLTSKGAWFTCENPETPDATIPVWPETRIYRVLERTQTAENLRKSGR